MKKVSLGARMIVLKGQTTDSGGGGVLGKLAEELEKLGLTVEMEEYMVGACAIHCLQFLQLSGPTNALIGEGGVDKRNAIQMLNCVYSLQGYMDWNVVTALMDEAQEWVDKYCETGYVPEDMSKPGDVQFAAKFNRVRQFRKFTPIGKQKWKHIKQCVQTRWKYTGEAVQYGYKYYLVLFKFSQMCINAKDSSNKINKVASDLQALLREPTIYSDVCLVKCFDDGYFLKHMEWLMQSKDLTNVCGFQQHQMLLRYFFMDRQLTELRESIKDSLEDHGSGFFHDFIASLDILIDPDVPPEQQQTLMTDEEQRSKALRFVEMSLDSLNKHFKRWASQKLLPAGLMGDRLCAEAVARLILALPPAPPQMWSPPVIQGAPEPSSPLSPEERSHHSRAHNLSFKVSKFEAFITAQYRSFGPNVDFPQSVKEAALLLLTGANFRAPLGKHQSHRLIWEMRISFLPMPSHTQMIERDVKDARTVSVTGRREEQRSNYSIIRSAHILGLEAEHGEIITASEDFEESGKKLKASTKVELLMKRIDAAMAKKAALVDKIGEEQFNAEFQEVKALIHGKGHFKQQRVDGVIEDMLAAAGNNKAENVRQRQTGVELTAGALGRIPYKSLKKGDHLDALRLELTARGVTDWKYPVDHPKAGKLMNWTDLKAKLIEMEKNRVAGDPNLLAIAEKGFVKQSAAEFKMTK